MKLLKAIRDSKLVFLFTALAWTGFVAPPLFEVNSTPLFFVVIAGFIALISWAAYLLHSLFDEAISQINGEDKDA